jgi:dihydropteroate synthase
MKSAGQNTAFSTNITLNIRGQLLDLRQPRVMGIINCTPDSFYEGSRANTDDEILQAASRMLEEGATFLDVGAYSSRPGADHIPEEEELRRAVHAIALLQREFPQAILSIDTFRAQVARACVANGAAMINDISGGSLDPKMIQTAGELRVPYVLMHMKGTPQTMREEAVYDNLIVEINQYFSEKIAALQHHGVTDIIIDPGFGFAKNIQQNFELLRHLHLLGIHHRPLMAGLSRKSMIWKTLNVTPADALNGTTALNMIALTHGASILRVHDVKAAREAIELFNHLNP